MRNANTSAVKNVPVVKEKRRNSEKRKEKSRDAARCRRSKETEIFFELAEQLPLSQNALSLMDKASIMRLAITFLKIRCFLDPRIELINNSSKNTFDSFYLKSLDGFLLVMSKDGDMIYLSENISHYLGLSQTDLMGNSIFDYTHPCDHDDIRDLLNLKPNEPNLTSVPFSIFIRMKNTLTSKGRNLTVRSASYKVIHCTGHVLTKPAVNKIEKPNETDCQNCFLTIGEPIPHPSNIEVPLGKLTFLSRHSLDMKFTYVDERVVDILGYTSRELLGKSVFIFFHASDCPFLEKSYKTLFAKGQSETSRYRFLAKYGGYVWVLTQSTVIYENNSKPQCVVCVNYVLSEREKKNEIVSEEQISRSMPTTTPEDDRPLLPKASTNKIFAPRTADMNTGFLTFLDDDSGLIVSKDEPEDLTHLAPQAGDVCISLDMEDVCSGGLFEDVLLEECSDSTLLSNYDCLSDKHGFLEDRCSMADYLVTNSKSSLLNKDPFLNSKDDPLLSSDSNKYLLESTTIHGRSSTLLQRRANKCPASPSQEGLLEKLNLSGSKDEEDDFALRAPYIPMSDVDDYLLLSSPESLLLETQPMGNSFPSLNDKVNHCSEIGAATKPYSSASVKSNLAKLLKGELRRHRIKTDLTKLPASEKPAIIVRKNVGIKNCTMNIMSDFVIRETNGTVGKSKVIPTKSCTNLSQSPHKDKQGPPIMTMDGQQKKIRSPVPNVLENHCINKERVGNETLRHLEETNSTLQKTTVCLLTTPPSTIENKQPFPTPPDPPPKRNGSVLLGPLEFPKKMKMDQKAIHLGSQKSVLLNLLVNGEDASHGYFCQGKNAQLTKYKLPSGLAPLGKLANTQQSSIIKNSHSELMDTQFLLSGESLVNLLDSTPMDLPALI